MEAEHQAALEERMEEIYHEVQRCRQALEWVEDHCKDNHLSANIQIIRHNLGLTEERLYGMSGYKPVLGEDVPFD